MSRQDMYFSEPDNQEETYVPRPVNDGTREQPRQVPPREEMYAGYQGDYPSASEATSWEGEKLRPRQEARPSTLWRWIGAFVLICFLIGLLIGYVAQVRSSSSAYPAHPPFYQDHGYRHHHDPGQQPQTLQTGPAHIFSVQSGATVNIDDIDGSINVYVDPNATDVTITAAEQRPGDEQSIGYQQPLPNDNTVAAIVAGNAGEIDFAVIVPPSVAHVNLNTQDGNVDVTGFQGQLVVQTNDGSINIDGGMLQGNGNVQTLQGDITFNGTLAAEANYTLHTQNGTVETVLPTDAAVHLNAQVSQGSIYTNTSGLNTLHTIDNGNAMQGNISGGPTTANLTIQDDHGDITISTTARSQ